MKEKKENVFDKLKVLLKKLKDKISKQFNKTNIILVLLVTLLTNFLEQLLVYPYFPWPYNKIANKDYHDKLNDCQSIVCQEVKKEEQIIALYTDAIENNERIPEEFKQLFIDSFIEYVILPYTDYFDEENIINMVAVATTFNFMIEKEAYKFLWLDIQNDPSVLGSYGFTFHRISIKESVIDSAKKENDYTILKKVLAHEVLHAVLRIDDNTTAFSNEEGLNEGINSYLSDKLCYSYERSFISSLLLILGDDTIKYYFDCDYEGFINYLSSYLQEDEIETILNILNNPTKSGKQELYTILKKLYVQKYGTTNNNLERLVFGKGSVNDINSQNDNKYEIYLVDGNKYILILHTDKDTEEYTFTKEELLELDIDAMLVKQNVSQTRTRRL